MKLLFFAAAFLAATPAHALTFPDRGTHAVVDAAHVIPNDQAYALNHRLAQWEHKTHHQLVVVTIPSLEGQDIADYSYKLGRAWHLGRSGADDAAILILAPTERKVRIDVGRGLESVLTDAQSEIIIQTAIVPKLKTGDIAGALGDGATAIMADVDAHEGDVADPPAQHTSSTLFLTLAALFCIAIVIALIYFIRKRRVTKVSPDNVTRPAPSDLPYGDDRIAFYPSYPTPNAPTRDFLSGAVAGALADEVLRPRHHEDDISSSVDTSDSSGLDWGLSTQDQSTDDTTSADDGFSSDNTDTDNFSGGGADNSY